MIFDIVINYIVFSLFHTVPNVPHYAKNKAIGVMKPGHTFTIEPMISEGQLHSHSINHSFILKGCGKTSHGRMAGLQ
jgi:methionine aminopeptidase